MLGYYISSVTNSGIDFVLFDLGGVIIELGGVSSLQEMAGSVGDEEQWHQWLATPWVRRFEKGECSATEFSTQVVAEWGLDVTPERFLEIFRDWPIGPYPGTTELLSELRRSVQIGCLSNTNSMHWEHQTSMWPVLDLFDFRFLSFEFGLAKPDEAIFRAVADRIPFRRDRILYFDDVALNSDAARSFGFRSEKVRGIGEVRTALCGLGMLPA
jgi:putative hydrolase of the HAD superfamily